MILLDLFSGTGGFHKGLSDAGVPIRKAYFSEIDKHAIANYKYNYPNAEHIGSVEHILNSGIERPNIITFGSPCQDFSLAGKRRGLGGERSSLIQCALSSISYFRPDIFIWENVKGAYSSNNSEDFWAIIKAFANLDGYRFESQLVNTSWILPQNRERIYLIGYLTTSFTNWKGVFPIGEVEREDNAIQGQSVLTNTIRVRKTADGWGSSFVVEGKQPQEEPMIFQKGHGFVGSTVSKICPTIRSNSFEHNTGVIQLNKEKTFGSVPHQQNRVYSDKGIMCCIQNARTESKVNILTNNKIRRLTEIECERLQGFPDNWTKYGNYNGEVKEISKTNRYKMIGNAVTAKMVELIGSKIKQNLRQWQ